MNVVLLEPEIPQNTANIGRSCAVTGSTLHLIKPLGFSVDEKAVRRAGLDYWKNLDVRLYNSFDDFMKINKPKKLFMATTKAENRYDLVRYEHDSYLMFGKESAGIPEDILVNHRGSAIRIPMLEGFRSLNLGSSVAIVLFEALRQNGFPGLLGEGAMHRLSWK